MCDIRRLQKLKAVSKSFFGNLQKIDPLSILSPEYVSRSGLTRSDLKDKIDKVAECSSIIELKEDIVKTNSGSFEHVMKIIAANYCKQQTICPVCADRTQSRRRARYNDVIRKQAEQVEAGKRFAYIVTFTIKDTEDLLESIETLREAKKKWRKMGQRRTNKKTGKIRRSGGESSKVVAGISTTEIKRGENSKLWHVHCHDLIFTDRRFDYRVYNPKKLKHLESIYGDDIPKKKLKEIAIMPIKFQGETVSASKVTLEWIKASKGISMGLDITPVRHVPIKAKPNIKKKLKKMSFTDSLCYQSKEVLTYFTKLNDNSDSDVLEVLNDTYNRRMVATYGEFFGIGGSDYEIETNKDDNCYVMKWEDRNWEYGDLIPGKARDVLGEKSTKTRKKVGELLGEYRRVRKTILRRREEFGKDLYYYLDNAKQNFKNQVASAWRLFRQAESAEKRMVSEGCDTYSPTIALTGAFIPGTNSKDVYSAAFS